MPRRRKPDTGSGQASSNRTDQMMAQPVQAPNGLPYGERAELEAAQQAAPMPQAVDPYGQVVQAAANYNFQPVGLFDPSQRPDQPLTAGMPSGPGPGPEVLRGAKSRNLREFLEKIALETGNEDIAAMVERVRGG